MNNQPPNDTVSEVRIAPPTEQGFYYYNGGAQTMIFLLTAPALGSQWYCIFDNGESSPCVWGYIEQALSVWELKKLRSDDEST